MMAAVVIMALAFALFREQSYHRLRDRWAREERYCREMSAKHHRERIICRENEKSGKPFDTRAREDYLLFGFGYTGLPGPFRSWAHEALDHDYWARGFHNAAEQVAAKKKAAERSLIFP